MAWVEIMPGVYAGVPDEVQAKVEVKAEAETTGDPSSGQTVPLYRSESHNMQSKLQAIAAALWQIAEKTGKAGKHLDSELAVACYVKSTSRQLRIGRRNTYPAAREADICRAAFGVPDTAGIKTYVAPKAWHVWEFTWEQRP